MLTLEQIIEAARHLLPTDRQQLQRWLQKQEAHDAVKQTHGTPPLALETPQQQMARFRKAMDWIAEHRAEYLGQWVVLHGAQLICHGTDAKTVYEQAKAVGITTPFLEQVLEEEKGAVMGGWL